MSATPSMYLNPPTVAQRHEYPAALDSTERCSSASFFAFLTMAEVEVPGLNGQLSAVVKQPPMASWPRYVSSAVRGRTHRWSRCGSPPQRPCPGPQGDARARRGSPSRLLFLARPRGGGHSSQRAGRSLVMPVTGHRAWHRPAMTNYNIARAAQKQVRGGSAGSAWYCDVSGVNAPGRFAC
jgi:hypothetical protein